MLEIRNLRATAGDTEILKGIDLTVNAGEVHAVMGPNGSGKSTLAQVLAGHPAYEVTSGSVRYRGQDLLDLEPEERAQAGLFLAFQYPVEIPGVSNSYFLKAALNAVRKHRGESDVDAFHQAALAAGGKDFGAPGVRAHYHPNYYGAFVLDPDGNNIEAVCHQPG